MANSDRGDVDGSARTSIVSVFTSHWLAMTGLGLLLTAIVTWAFLVAAQLRHGGENPYIGVAITIVGVVFALGLLLTPIGLLLGRRRLRAQLVTTMTNRTFAWRRLLVFLAVVSLINVAIASQMTVRAVHSMESRQFCGSCHVMTPESRAFSEGPHARILCVDCHVGEGATGFLKSKIQGTHQLWAVLTDKVPKPISGAIERGLMVPSAETCEQCHWKEQPAKAKVKLIQRYADDEANTPSTTLLTMNVGGTRTGGIHGVHHGEGVEILFVSDDAKREKIPLVEYHDTKRGVVRTYVDAGLDAASLADRPRIKMQCFDCHNRPAHAFEPADRAVDRALLLGRIDATLPWVKKHAMEVLTATYADSAAAAAAIPAAMTAAYATNHPDVATARRAEIEEAGRVVADIYSRNVFPEFGVAWGTYPNHLGHTDASEGCFRCHDGDHATADGATKITKDCFRCHFPAAVDETEPEVLKLLGIDKVLKNRKPK